MKIVNSLKIAEEARQELPHRAAQGPRLRHQQGEPALQGAPGLSPAARRPSAGATEPMKMPTPDAAVLRGAPRSPRRCAGSCRAKAVIASEAERRAYESDGLTAYRQPPLVAVLPSTDRGSRGGAALLPGAGRQGRAARRRHLAVGRRAAAGRRRAARHGQVQPHPRHRLRQSLRRWCSRASPISAITQAVEHAGFYYAPDPSSQIACTIGGNVAENSGGVHCLKYGLTTNNRARRRDRDDRRRGDPPRRQASRCRGLRSARRDDRVGRAARRRHRGDGAHPAKARRRRARC